MKPSPLLPNPKFLDRIEYALQWGVLPVYHLLAGSTYVERYLLQPDLHAAGVGDLRRYRRNCHAGSDLYRPLEMKIFPDIKTAGSQSNAL